MTQVNNLKLFTPQLLAVSYTIQTTPTRMMTMMSQWMMENKKIGEVISTMMNKMTTMIQLGKLENQPLKLSMQLSYHAQFSSKNIGLSLSSFSPVDSWNVMTMLNAIFLKHSKI